MAYGQESYAQQPYGGFSFDGTGPSLVSTTPADLTRNIPWDVAVVIVLTSPDGFDPWAFDVTLGGKQAIVGGAFLPGYGGTISLDESTCTITISTHPLLAEGSDITLNIAATNLANVSDSWSVSFHTLFEADISETVSVAEGFASAQQGAIDLTDSAFLDETSTVSTTTLSQSSESVPVTETLSSHQEGQTDLTESSALIESLATQQTGSLALTETVTESETLGAMATGQVLAVESVTTSVALWVPENDIYFDEAVSVSGIVAANQNFWMGLTEAVPLVEDLLARSFTATAFNGTTLRLDFVLDLALDGTTDPTNYSLTGEGYPLTIRDIAPVQEIRQSGSQLTVVVAGNSFWSNQVNLADGVPTNADIGGYLQVGGQMFEILAVAGTVLTLAGKLPVLPNDPQGWRILSAVRAVVISHTKATDGALYHVRIQNLRGAQDGTPVQGQVPFLAVAEKPRLISATADQEGTIIVGYDSSMRADGDLVDPSQYTIPGVRILFVYMADSSHVVLQTRGMSSGSFTLTVNAVGTPKDEAGNPIDPIFNQVIFTGYTPINERSIFTDFGPLAKPPDDQQTGVAAEILNQTDVELPGAIITPSHVGLYIILAGTALNAGSFRITARLSATRVQVKACFTYPDPDSGAITWILRDPRDGQIADDPADVIVRINGSPVTPDAVVGLLGQIVLSAVPDPADDIQVDYHWCQNPTVEIRRLNSKEFRLNCWNQDQGAISDTQHKYRFNTVLTTPTEYVPDDLQALLDQPVLRDLHYRAYERAYTAVLNDPVLFTLNAPPHRIAYPPMSRGVAVEFVRYEAKTLPEADPTSPWTRVGTGTATVTGGALTVVDDSSGPYPTGQPLFWTRDIDLSFRAAFATSWRGYVTATTEPDGVFVGVAAGYGDGDRLVMVGMLLDGGIRKIGLLRRGGGNDPALLEAWAGGLDVDGSPTGAPVEFDWSIVHSYRTYRDPDGNVRVFVDGSVVETLRLTREELPFLEELDDPFEGLQGVFFGALSRPARSSSTWDFYRYLVLPLNPYQIAPTSFCSYEGDVLPESATKPWTPCGHHGVETILANDILLLDSTSASTQTDVGLATGDFRGFVRLEPLLPAASEVMLDLEMQLVTHTHGITPDAVMAAMDDGNHLVQLCFFSDTPVPKKSYGGRALPTSTIWNWQTLGSATAEMIGQVLRITDSTTLDGRIFFIEDTAPSADRTVSGSTDWMLEFRCAVLSYTPETGADPKFAGVTAQVYDDTRLVGLMTCTVGGAPKLAWHSDGIAISTIDYDWDDSELHTYRVVKNTSGDLVSLFVDGVYVASTPYSTFHVPAVPDPIGVISFGSATPASVGAKSVVDWVYANAWRTLASFRRYVGVWKGHDSTSLIGYHLPLKASGTAASVAGNGLGDLSASFLAAGVAAGDALVIDSGPNKGVYEIAAVTGPNTLTIVGTFPFGPTQTSYRIPAETDWSIPHRYRMVRSPVGNVSVLFDTDPIPLITLDYGPLNLPPSPTGIVQTLSTGLPAIAWGQFDPNNLSQVKWWHIRYGISRSPTELRIAPHHQHLNQWNVIASAGHLRTTIAHTHTGYMSCSTGTPPNTELDLFNDPALVAYTKLNEGTPLVPLTQTWDVCRPQPVEVPISALNRIEDVLNTDPDFVLNDSRTRIEIDMPDDVLYTSLQIVEHTEGEEGLVKPLDNWLTNLGEISYVKEVCLHYDGSVLPENDPAAPTPWQRVSDDPARVTASALAGILTYGTDSIGTRTVYKNRTPLTDAPGLEIEASYHIKVAQDTTWGMGDTLMRVGLSGLGYTIGLAFVTSSIGERLVIAYDLSNGNVLGSVMFDYLDGVFHTYKIIRDIKHNSVRIEVVA